MKALFIILLICPLMVFAEGNQPFITESVLTNFWLFTPVTNQMDDAHFIKTSRPANDDPEGNWGIVSEGFQLSIRLDKPVFTNGDLITASVLLRNVTNQPVKFFFFNPGDHALKLKVIKEKAPLSDSNGEKSSDEIIKASRSRDLTGNRWTETIPVGKQREILVDMTNYYNLPAGHYKIQAEQSIINLEHTAPTNVVSGYAEFSIVEKTTGP